MKVLYSQTCICQLVIPTTIPTTSSSILDHVKPFLRKPTPSISLLCTLQNESSIIITRHELRYQFQVHALFSSVDLNTSIMTTEWSLDYCLVCDRQTLGGPYCSQSCRLAELDHVTSEALRSSTTKGVTTHSYQSGTSAYSSWNVTRALSPSSSHTSLSSLRSSSSLNSTVSDRFQNELRDYASSFDQVRDLKRRMTS